MTRFHPRYSQLPQTHAEETVGYIDYRGQFWPVCRNGHPKTPENRMKNGAVHGVQRTRCRLCFPKNVTVPSDRCPTPQGRFMQKWRQAESGCWEWTASIGKKEGYGRFGDTWAHRKSWEFFRGPIPKGLTIDHLCRNRKCVNPDHLEPVSLVENIRRGMSPAHVARRAGTCQKGHPMLTMKSGRRYCRPCSAERARRRYAAGKRSPSQIARAARSRS